MAIKVNGTTVIDDSRNLVNIVSGAGASTDFNAVGTYALVGNGYDGTRDYGVTTSGSNLFFSDANSNYADAGGDAEPAGTWRIMGILRSNGQATVAVRIS